MYTKCPHTTATEDLFCKMKSSNHCLHPLLPPDRTLNQVLRTRGHSFQLPTCSFNLHKKSFVISCLFKFLTWVCSCFVYVVFSFLNFFFFKCFSNFLVSLLTFSFNFCPLLLRTTVAFTYLFLHARLLLLFNQFCNISSRQHLQSAATGTLLVPCARTATEQRSFVVNGPATWNRLPPALRSPDLSESAFKRALKTHLFSTARRHCDCGARYKYPDLLTYLLTYGNKVRSAFVTLVESIYSNAFTLKVWLQNTETASEALCAKQLDINIDIYICMYIQWLDLMHVHKLIKLV